MTCADLLDGLTRRGFCLEIYEDGIRVRLREKMTDADRQAIRANKSELLALLLKAKLPLEAERPTQEAMKEPAKPEVRPCPTCDWPPPGDPDCPACRLLRPKKPPEEMKPFPADNPLCPPISVILPATREDRMSC
jgi:hypothetical protein